MARASQNSDFEYEFEQDGVVAVVGAKCLVEMDKFNIGTTDNKIKITTSTTETFPFHISLDKNKNKYGIHPRHLELEFESNVPDTTCNVVDPKRKVKVVVLTLEQFNLLNEFDRKLPPATAQPNTTIRINHTADGTGFLDYRIIKKVSERQL